MCGSYTSSFRFKLHVTKAELRFEGDVKVALRIAGRFTSGQRAYYETMKTFSHAEIRVLKGKLCSPSHRVLKS